jgi:hypothetical protein
VERLSKAIKALEERESELRQGADLLVEQAMEMVTVRDAIQQALDAFEARCWDFDYVRMLDKHGALLDNAATPSAAATHHATAAAASNAEGAASYNYPQGEYADRGHAEQRRSAVARARRGLTAPDDLRSAPRSTDEVQEERKTIVSILASRPGREWTAREVTEKLLGAPKQAPPPSTVRKVSDRVAKYLRVLSDEDGPVCMIRKTKPGGKRARVVFRYNPHRDNHQH